MVCLTKHLLVVVATAAFAGSAFGFCFDEAARRYGVSPILLKSIAKHESGFRSDIEVRNTNGSVDVGLMGINSVHLHPYEALGRQGVTVQDLKDACFNVMVGAYLLRRKVDKHGYTWSAVGAYHSETPEFSQRYQMLIWNASKSMR